MAQLNLFFILGSQNEVTVKNDLPGGETPESTETLVDHSEKPKQKGVFPRVLFDNFKFVVFIVVYELLNSVLSQYFAV